MTLKNNAASGSSPDARMVLEAVLPEEIENKSFEIIAEELARMGKTLDPETAPVVMRAIHTSADFEYADNLIFSFDAVKKAHEALRSGATIVTDTTMALAGINKHAMKELGISGYCYISDAEVIAKAKAEGTTRSSAAVDTAFQRHGDNIIYVCGNAPTALIRLNELIKQGRALPKLIIGVPVGFVNVVQSKELIISLNEQDNKNSICGAQKGEIFGIPYIVARGRKGGSNIAASIVNALMYQITRKNPL